MKLVKCTATQNWGKRNVWPIKKWKMQDPFNSNHSLAKEKSHSTILYPKVVSFTEKRIHRYSNNRAETNTWRGALDT